MAKASDVYTEIRTKLSGLKRSEKMALVVFALTVVAALAMLSLWGTKSRYVTLVTGAADEELRDVTTVLEEKGEDFRVEDGGRVLVRQERKTILAAELSRRGVVPGEKIIGFAEVMEKDSFYTTRDRRRFMMQVALQNELGLMIGNLSAIERAKVLIKEGRQSDIFGEGRPGGASVTVHTRAGKRLTPKIVNSIAGIVKSAVPNIDPADITIVDARTNRTYRPEDKGEELFEAPSFFRLKEDVERALADKVRGMFLHMGVDAVVVVNAELDLQKVREKIQNIDPDKQGPFPVSERRTKSTANEPARESGVAGITAQDPSAVGATAIGGVSPIATGAAPATAPVTTETSEDRESTYTYSYLLREITSAPKGLAKVSVSVVLFDRIVEKNGKIEYDGTIVKQSLDDFKKLVANALGIVTETDVIVKHMPSAGPVPVVAGVGVKLVSYWEMASKALMLIMAVAAFLGIYLMLRKFVGVVAGATKREELVAVGDDRIGQLQGGIGEQVRDKPERVARILSRWIGK